MTVEKASEIVASIRADGCVDCAMNLFEFFVDELGVSPTIFAELCGYEVLDKVRF